jgi:uncharacterized membrane protein YdjX (TVP38/TMEM64 family)
MSMSSRLRLLTLLAAVGAVALAFVFLPVRDYLRQFLDWVQGLGLWAGVVIAVAYVPATVLAVPGSALTLVAGFTCGLLWGTVFISIGSTLGASAAFLVGRFLARGWVEEKLGGSPRLRALDDAVAGQGFKIVLLTRLSPVFPFNLLNYAFSLTKVSFRDYILASWLGMLPGTVLYVYLGTLAGDLAELLAGNVERPPEYYVLLVVGLAATVLVTVYVTRLARQALAKAAPQAVEQSGEWGA